MKTLKNLFTSKINFGVESAVLIIGTLLSTVVLAGIEDEVRQFQDAINYAQNDEGCRSIPYTDLQRDCVNKQREKNKWCSESGELSCKGLDKRTIESELEKLKQEYAITKDENARANIKKQIDQLAQKVAENRSEVIKRLEVVKICREYRSSVMDVFKYASQKVYNETEQELRPLADTLYKGYKDREPGHEEAVKNVQLAFERCQGLIYEIDSLGTISTP